MDTPLTILYKPLRKNHPIPSYGSDEAICADAYASIEAEEGQEIGKIWLQPNELALIPLGFAVAMPSGWELQVRPRSGNSINGLIVVNAPGCVDPDFSGEVKAIVKNIGDKAFVIKDGMRIVQVSPAKVPRMIFKVVDSLPETIRGSAGFGSTGI